MRYEFHLAYHDRARVWIGDCPFSAAKATGSERRRYDVGSAPGHDLRAAIEILLPRGPRAMYGLLGATYQAQIGGSELTVDVAFTTDHRRPEFTDSQAVKTDVARVGLPREYVEAVLEGIQEALAANPVLGPGHLSIDCAASADVGSSPATFSVLAKALLWTLARGEADADSLRTAVEGLTRM